MLTIRKEQIDAMARGIFIKSLDAAFSRDVPGFADHSTEERRGFLNEAIALAETKGLKSEQGLASYALAIWWLGVDFEQKSKELESLLNSSYPEVRRVYAMNEWVYAMIGDPDNVVAADEALQQGLNRTKPWGLSQ